MAAGVNDTESLLERKRLLSLPPLSNFYVLATAADADVGDDENRLCAIFDTSCSPSSPSVTSQREFIPSPPTPPSSASKRRQCSRQYSDDSIIPYRKGVGFGDTVKVHFYTDDFEGGEIGIRLANTKTFDGRSDSVRGKLYDDSIEEFVNMMSVCDNVDDDEDEGMVLDYKFNRGLGRCGNRSRAYADSNWSLSSVEGVSRRQESEGLDLLWYMENTPCDMDLRE
jgi:hypothetical protein